MGELTMRSCNREVRPFFCFSAVLPYNVMPMRMLSLHTRFCFLLQRSCFAWFAFWWANRLKWQVCFIFFFSSANCQLLWNGEERREPSISISAFVVPVDPLRLVAFRIDMSSHLWLWLKKYKKNGLLLCSKKQAKKRKKESKNVMGHRRTSIIEKPVLWVQEKVGAGLSFLA